MQIQCARPNLRSIDYGICLQVFFQAIFVMRFFLDLALFSSLCWGLFFLCICRFFSWLSFSILAWFSFPPCVLLALSGRAYWFNRRVLDKCSHFHSTLQLSMMGSTVVGMSSLELLYLWWNCVAMKLDEIQPSRASYCSTTKNWTFNCWINVLVLHLASRQIIVPSLF